MEEPADERFVDFTEGWVAGGSEKVLGKGGVNGKVALAAFNDGSIGHYAVVAHGAGSRANFDFSFGAEYIDVAGDSAFAGEGRVDFVEPGFVVEERRIRWRAGAEGAEENGGVVEFLAGGVYDLFGGLGAQPFDVIGRGFIGVINGVGFPNLAYGEFLGWGQERRGEK